METKQDEPTDLIESYKFCREHQLPIEFRPDGDVWIFDGTTNQRYSGNTLTLAVLAYQADHPEGRLSYLSQAHKDPDAFVAWAKSVLRRIKQLEVKTAALTRGDRNVTEN